MRRADPNARNPCFATIRFTLPQDSSSTPEEPNRNLNIVIAEDNASDVFLFEQALEYRKIEATLTCHRDGENMLHYIDCIDAGTTPCPDVVLLDLNLPRYDGKAILARMRKSAVCSHAPVVIVSSSKVIEDQADAARLGATRYFYKSIDFEETMRLGAVVLEGTSSKDND